MSEFDLIVVKIVMFNYKVFYEVEVEYDYLYVNVIFFDGLKVLLDIIGDKVNNVDGFVEIFGGKWEDKSYDLM